MQRIVVLLLTLLLFTGIASAGVTGSISGTVTDPTGGAVVGASVVATNVATGVKSSIKTNAEGFYSFPNLPIGTYSVDVQAQGFAPFQEKNLILNVNTALRLDAALKMGTISEQVVISATAAQVDTQSTQMGELVGGKEMVTVPLNGRDYTSLMALQPGVIPVSTSTINSYTPGTSEGTLSVSGGRPNSNGFMVNGGNTMEPMQNGTSVIPNLDSVAEFRILTNNFDAEYGHYSGGVVNVVTKSGTNEYHGDVFEFLRNTSLNARNYFNPASNGLPKAKYIQNQFGGTFGGPLKKNQMFFFADYEGTRIIQGAGNSTIPVPSLSERQGNFLDRAAGLTGLVTGPAVAQQLTQQLGYAVTEGEPFYILPDPANNILACTTTDRCVFPNAVIPQTAVSPVATGLLKYLPAPNTATGQFSNSGSASNSHNDDNKGGIRIDANSARWGLLSGYYHIDDYTRTVPDLITIGGVGNTATRGRSQLITLGDTKTFSNYSVNELRLSYMRNAAVSGAPSGPAVDPASVGFATGCNTLGICPVSPFITLPQIQLNAITFGGPYGGNNLRVNTYQVTDNYTRIIGNHSLKFGGIYSLTQANMQTSFANNGVFGFNGGTETGLDFADFLLGAPASYQQGVQLPLYNRARYYGLFAQDSWRLTKDLTLNYGLRWDVTTPWWEKYNHMEALVPGVQSASFPTAPVGWTVPGDPGVPRTVAPTRYHNFAPRLGIAYSLDPKGKFWEKLTGGSGKSSIRASWGMFYTDLEDYTNANGNGDAPYGLYWVSPTPSMFATPWVDLYTGASEGQRFPIPLGTINASPSHPDSTVNWAQYMPISSSPTYYYKNQIPYTESYMLSLQRQFGAGTILTASYVGTQGHHLMAIIEANPANPALCLSVSQGSQVAPGSNTCGPGAETGTFTKANGEVIQVRQSLGPTGGSDFGSTGWFRTLAFSSYNSLDVTVRHTTGRLTLLGGYTYSKSMDNSSTATDQVHPYNPHLSRALSAFDITHNLVLSYSYELPFDKLFHPGRLTSGWVISGITRFATGLPITLSETDDNSLIGATSVGPGSTLDEPNYAPGKLYLNTDPRKNSRLTSTKVPYFDNALFSTETLGQFGNARRRFFHGPGTNNWDLALLKDIRIRESKTLQFRAELFNAFNHTQFNGPDGNINDVPDYNAGTGFGFVNSANDARVAQFALKVLF